jgi:hypothetical protein
MHLAQDRDQWRTLVNTVMNLGVPQNARSFLTVWMILAYKEGLCSMESAGLKIPMRSL